MSKIVQLLKGETILILRKEFPGLKEFCWEANFWPEGYLAETVGICNQLIFHIGSNEF
jgi:REP element-mobilizing transposase RayT